MGDFDGHIARMEDWTYLLGPKETFTSMLNDDAFSLKNVNYDIENISAHLFEGSQGLGAFENHDTVNQSPFDIVAGENVNANVLVEPQTSNKGGFNGMIVFTNDCNANDLGLNSDMVSPSVLLNSPVFINNPQYFSSPTIEKYTISKEGDNRHLALPIHASDKGNANVPPDFNASSFGFNGASSFSYPGATDRVNSSSSFAPESIVGLDLSPPPNEPQEDNMGGTIEDHASSGDGYSWRKYYNKNILGSEFPRIYFKCAVTHCPARKQVQQSIGGHNNVTYKGNHRHPKYPLNHSSTLGSSSAHGEIQLDQQLLKVFNGDPTWPSVNQNNLEPMYSLPRSCSVSQSHNVTELMNRSSTFSSDRDDGLLIHHNAPLRLYGEGGETQSKKRRIQCYTPDMGANRSSREPRIVLRTKSEVDMMDDGYRWRKYGQKVVGGNSYPSYYKCTSNNCNVRRHIERASSELEFVRTTYEGVHNHGIPATRNSLYFGSTVSNSLPTQQPSSNSNIHEPSRIHTDVSQSERLEVDSSMILENNPQLG